MALRNCWRPYLFSAASEPHITYPDNSRPLFHVSQFGLVRPRITQLDDPHLRPPQSLLLGLGRAKQKLLLQGSQDEVTPSPMSFVHWTCSVGRALDPWGSSCPGTPSPPALFNHVTYFLVCSLVPWCFPSSSRYGMKNLCRLLKLWSSINVLFKAQKKNTPREVQRSQTQEQVGESFWIAFCWLLWIKVSNREMQSLVTSCI